MSADPTTSHLNRRHFLQGGLGLALLGSSPLATSACSAQQSGGGATKSVSLLSWDPKSTMQPVFDAFTKKTGIDVTWTYVKPVEEYVSRLQEELQAGTAPDVFAITAENMNLVGQGYVRAISDQPVVDVMNSANREFMTVGGKVYGLSVASWTGGILYNKALLAKAGAATLPDSWDGFLRLCAKLKSLGIAPYYDVIGDGSLMALFGLVGAYFADRGHFPEKDIFDYKTTFAETWTEPLVAYGRLYTDGLVPPSVLHLGTNQVISDFADGKVAMFGAATWNMAAVQKAAPPHLSFDTAAIPGIAPGTSYWAGAAGPGHAINAKAKNLESALKLLQFLGSPDGAQAFCTSSGAITTTTDYTPTVAPVLDSFAKGARSGRIYLPVVRWPRHAQAVQAELLSQCKRLAAGLVKPQDIPLALDKKLRQLDGK